MSSIETLLGEVKEEADRRQDELIRRVTVNYPVGGKVCDFQAHDARLRKLKRKAAKADQYIGHLKSRQKFLAGNLAEGRYVHHMEMMTRRCSEYSEYEQQLLETHAGLTEEIGRLEVLIRLCVACGKCTACAPRTTLRRTEKWQTKRSRLPRAKS